MSTITINTNKKRFPVAKDLYGLFFEDISHSGDGGLYPEMIRNRSFEDSILPKDCVSEDQGCTFVSPTGWIDEFNNGEGMNKWVSENEIEKTPVPGWYAEHAEMELKYEGTLNANRKAALSVHFAPGGCIKNVGYKGVPQIKGESYSFVFYAKAERPVTICAAVKSPTGTSTECTVVIDGDFYKKYELSLLASETTGEGVLYLAAKDGGEATFGFTSLMPNDTYKGHGLRKDLCEKLEAMHPAFMRFPGGCIVEGFTMETVWFFRNMVGPVEERKSHWLLWHYRATNGLGFHEYLQLCEDLGAEPLYVCNCGMTCQGRKPYYFNEEEQADMLEDIFAALEYALGDENTRWGALRAKMGHPQPFRMNYLEIGNENNGEEYARRFHPIREAVLKKYPHLIIVANERGKGENKLTADIVDDHYYNMPEFFAENIHIYDSYDRSEPGLFVGEFAVNQTYEGQLRAAVSEAMFMVGMERNQDVVRLCSYAPLFQHVHFGSWFPNLINFDNYRSFAIPTYYAFRLFGSHRGENVVESTENPGKIYTGLHGVPALSGDYGVRFRSPRINGIPVKPMKDIMGKSCVDENGDFYISRDDENMNPWYVKMNADPLTALEGDIEGTEYTFETEVFVKEGERAGVGILCSPKPLSYYDRTNPNPEDPWTLRFLELLRWNLKDGKSYVTRGNVVQNEYKSAVSVKLKQNAYNTLRYETTPTMVRLFVNGELVDTVELPYYQSMTAMAADSQEEIVIKLANIHPEADEVTIYLDCDVEEEYTVYQMAGEAEDENSLENPRAVCDTEIIKHGAGKTFVFPAPGMSVNVLVLKKRR